MRRGEVLAQAVDYWNSTIRQRIRSRKKRGRLQRTAREKQTARKYFGTRPPGYGVPWSDPGEEERGPGKKRERLNVEW